VSVTVFANVFYGASHRPCRNPHDAAHRQLPRRRKSDKRSRCAASNPSRPRSVRPALRLTHEHDISIICFNIDTLLGYTIRLFIMRDRRRPYWPRAREDKIMQFMPYAPVSCVGCVARPRGAATPAVLYPLSSPDV